MAVTTIATASDFLRIQEESSEFFRRSYELKSKAGALSDKISSLQQLDRQIRDIERIAADAQKLYQEMEEFKNRAENQEIFRYGAGIAPVIIKFNSIQQGVKTLSILAKVFKRDDVPQIRATLSKPSGKLYS